MGPGRSERKKEQTGAGAAGRGAKPGRAVVGWCGRKREGRRRRWLGRGNWAFGPNERGEFYLFIYLFISNSNSFSYLVFQNLKLNSKQIQV